MSNFQAGQDVTVNFDGVEYPGTVEKAERGWVTAIIQIDPAQDHGALTPRLSPQSIVCVPKDRVTIQPAKSEEPE